MPQRSAALRKCCELWEMPVEAFEISQYRDVVDETKTKDTSIKVSTEDGSIGNRHKFWVTTSIGTVITFTIFLH